MVEQLEYEIKKCLEMIVGLTAESQQSGLSYGKKAMLSRRISQWRQRLAFYSNKVKSFGAGTIITVRILGWKPGDNISHEYSLTYVNINEAEAVKIAKINSKLLYGLNRIEILEVKESSTGINKV